MAAGNMPDATDLRIRLRLQLASAREGVAMSKLPTGFGADELAAAMVLTSQPHTPTQSELDDALLMLFPDGTAPTVADLVANGLLTYTIDKQRLRVPPALLSNTWQGFNSTNSVVARPNVTSPSAGPKASSIIGEAVKAVGSDSTASLVDPNRLFSYFTGPISNTSPRAAITVQQLHAVLLNPPQKLRERISAARTEYQTNGNVAAYKALKIKLDYFSVGGIFTRRADAALEVASGLLVVDLDHLNDQLEEARAALLADTVLAPSLALLFVSPSGNGLKVILAADPHHPRSTNYEFIASYLSRNYGWGMTYDDNTAEISRACFLSYDPTAWLAPCYTAAPSRDNSALHPIDS